MFYASWVNPISLDFTFVWRFIVDIKFVSLYFLAYLPGVVWNFSVFSKKWFSKIKQIFLLVFSLSKQRMNFGLMTLNTLPSSLRQYVGKDNKHLRQTTERGGERMNFYQMPNLYVLFTGPGTCKSPNFDSRRGLLISGSSGIWEVERSKLIHLFM